MNQKNNSREFNPFILLIIIPFQLLFDFLVLHFTFELEFNCNPDAHRYPIGLMTATMFSIMSVITLVVIILTLFSIIIIYMVRNKRMKAMVNQLVRYRMIFTGRVQGVGFRYTANNAANQYHLTGYVKNEYDGSVTVEVQGAEEAIYLFIKSLANDRYIAIDDIQKQQIPIEADERGFIVQY